MLTHPRDDVRREPLERRLGVLDQTVGSSVVRVPRTATAPLAAACVTWSCPSVCSPTKATKRLPAPASRPSMTTGPVTTTAVESPSIVPPTISATSSSDRAITPPTLEAPPRIGSGRLGDMAEPLRPATRTVHAGRPPHEPDQPLNVPITMASTYVAGGDREYGRTGNPTWQAFEAALGDLEGGRALAFSSGLAAVSTVLGLVANGATVVAPRVAYNGTILQLADLESRERVVTRLIDIDDTAGFVKACDEDVALVWLESPTNPSLELADIATIAEAAHAAGATVVVDNTFATPLLQQPLSLGADLVVHSATKYLGGHSDLLMGAVVAADDALWDVLKGRRDLLGAIPGTLEAFLALRGMRTLHVRVERAQANAAELARRLADHPEVAEVRYPGFGAMVSILLAGGPDAADAISTSTRLWVHTTSLGGVESTLERRRRWAAEPKDVPDSLLRLSVGIEDVEDLWADLAQALASVTGPA